MDSTKIEIVSHTFDRLVNHSAGPKSNPNWETLVPLLIGAGLTFLAQWSIEWTKSRREKRQKKNELISKASAKSYLICQILKDVAMYKSHKQYYIAAGDLNISKEQEADFYHKHYEKGQEQRKAEIQLDETIAEYFQIITEYQVVTNQRNLFKSQFQKIKDFEHPKPKRLENVLTVQELEDGLSKEEERLNQEYFKLTSLFDEIEKLM